MRFSILLLFFISVKSVAQMPLYNLAELDYSNSIPAELNNSRCAVIVSTQDILEDFTKVGEWGKLSEQAHSAFIKMKIDPVVYVSQYNLTASTSAISAYLEIFNKRKIANFIFVSQVESGFEIVITPNTQGEQVLSKGQSAYFVTSPTLKETLLSLGREIRRAELVQGNFLIPEKATFLSGISIIENTQLKNYPGQLRRSILAVERFKKIPETSEGESVSKNVKAYNQEVDRRNVELDSLMKSYPYEYVLIDHMSDDDLKRNRYQFLLRSASGSTVSVRKMLEFPVVSSETDFVSVIPIMPDKTSIKSIPKDAIVTKFYVRQNISKNVHVGEWDADETWQLALKNMIGNLSQRLVINK